MSIKPILYHTKDAGGKTITKEIFLKECPTVKKDFFCKICGKEATEGTRTKDIVSSKFNDWNYVGEYICPSCTRYFGLQFYNYIVNGDEIRVLNVAEMAKEIKKAQTPPFKIVITKSRKKHLFYRSIMNYDSSHFTVNLEEEQITVELEELKQLFIFVEALLDLGEKKEALQQGIISYNTLKQIGYTPYYFLQEKLKQRQIQIPLFLAQKQGKREEATKCILDLIQKK